MFITSVFKKYVIAEAVNFQNPPEGISFFVTKDAANSFKLKPRVGQKFSEEEQTKLKDWISSVKHNFQTISAKPTGVTVVLDPLSIPIIETPRDIKHRAKKQQRQQQEQARKDDLSKSITDNEEASKWIDTIFGENTMGNYNKNELIKFLKGNGKPPIDGVTWKWTEGFKKLGFSEQELAKMTIPVLFSKLKEKYNTEK